jgi:DNA-binding response OmpR family regulator
LEISLRLLVVEDDPDLNRQLTTALTDAGYVVDRAFDGEEGHFLGGPVSLDTRTGRVSVAGNPIKMTSHEYRLLAYLMHHTGRVVSRTELVEHLYDQDFDRDSNTIEVFVGRIRKKLDVDIIQTVRGLGYLLTPPAPNA